MRSHRLQPVGLGVDAALAPGSFLTKLRAPLSGHRQRASRVHGHEAETARSASPLAGGGVSHRSQSLSRRCGSGCRQWLTCGGEGVEPSQTDAVAT
jgi:hypothetical protein